ncbi:MBL fold metallo-hydrolase [Caenimonas koreensis]|uniref:MBL fold metallo-hydrolase n=1 Tax=Caenimonas koreensis TaxID=367474 RepID=UPI003782F41C
MNSRSKPSNAQLSFTFIGHQTWLLSSPDANILLDPVLERSFGNSKHINFEIYPPRSVDIERMPELDAILLSHEHLDHFHLSSLNRLSRQVPVIVGKNMPMCVRDAIRKLGFEVRVQPFEQPIEFGDTRVSMHAPAAGTVFWEKRVSQYFITHGEVSCFIAVDALTSDRLEKDVVAGRMPVPDLIIVSNNSMVTPPGARAASPFSKGKTSLLSPGTGLSILDDLVGAAGRIAGPHTHIAICGDGHIDHVQDFGPFLHSDNKRLAELANGMGYQPVVHGPYPGERISIFGGNKFVDDRVSWIDYDGSRHEEQKHKLLTFLKSPVQGRLTGVVAPYVEDAQVARDIDIVEVYLVQLARLLLQLPPGRNVLAATEREWPNLGDRRVVVRFLVGDGRVAQYGLNVVTAKFERDTTPTARLTQVFPCGFEAFLRDFAAILRGEIQVWDIAGRSTYSWNLGDSYQGIEAVLLGDLGEQVRPELHTALFNAEIDRLLGAQTMAAA